MVFSSDVRSLPPVPPGKLNALKCIRFYPCSTLNDFECSLANGKNTLTSFPPLYAHSFFEDESIFGWADCSISILYTPDNLDVYIQIEGCLNGSDISTSEGCVRSVVYQDDGEANFSFQNDRELVNGECNVMSAIDRAKNDILNKLLTVSFPGGFCKTEEEFRQRLTIEEKRKFKCIGTSYMEFTLPNSYSADSINRRSIDTVMRRVVFCQHDTTPQIIHRRIEWFLHFLIDACSSIEYDPRWTILVAYIRRPLKSVTNPTRKRLRSATYSEGQKLSTDVDNLSTEKALSTQDSKTRIKSTRVDGSRTAFHGTIKSLQTNGEGENSPSRNNGVEYLYELAGFISLYKFFSLPKCRRRISQFAVFPPFQGVGLGLALLEIAHRATLSEDVLELTVEDPAHSFRQLRDVVSLKIAVDRKIIGKEDLYAPQEMTITEELFKEQLLAKVATLKTELKESPMQSSRIKEILHLAKFMPHPPPPPPVLLFQQNAEANASCDNKKFLRSGDITSQGQSPPSLRHDKLISIDSCNTDDTVSTLVSRDWRPINRSAAKDDKKSNSTSTSFSSCAALKPYRIHVKKRLRAENIEWICPLKPSRARHEIEVLWLNEYASYYRTICKLRNIFPLHHH